MSNLRFIKSSGCLILSSPPHVKIDIDRSDVLERVKAEKALLGRYFSDSPLGGDVVDDFPHRWWHCVRTEPVSLETLSAKGRYRVRKGLSNNVFRIATPDDISQSAPLLLEVMKRSFADYPKVYSPAAPTLSDVERLARIAAKELEDIWLVTNRESGELAGYAHCGVMDGCVAISSVKIDPRFLATEANAALAYTICRHYINESGYRYVIDGERNIRHLSKYQDFLVSVLGFRKVFCKLHVVYHPLVRPIVAVLYPFRGIFKAMDQTNRLIYNISCILRQEEIARCFNK